MQEGGGPGCSPIPAKKQFQTIVEFAASLLSLLAADGFFRYLRKNAVSENVVSFLPPYDSAGKIVGEES